MTELTDELERAIYCAANETSTGNGLYASEAKVLAEACVPIVARHVAEAVEAAQADMRPLIDALACWCRPGHKCVACQLRALAADLCEYNPGHGDFLTAGKSLRAVLSPHPNHTQEQP